MKKNIFLFLIIIFTKTFSQNKIECGFNDKITNSKKLRTSFKTSILPNSNSIIRIPVVFHVYHHGEGIGSGFNISEDTLKKTILDLNLAFSGKGKYSQTIDTKIEFYLLKDSINCSESGIPSNGIKRADLNNLPPYLVQNYFQVGINPGSKQFFDKEINRLSPNPVSIRCLNIRLIPYFNGLVGSVSLGDLEDVMLCTGCTIGSNLIEVFTHEIGHVLGLSHTFFGSDNNCTDGDGLSDTDPHRKDDIFFPDDINLCTGQKKGKVIYNFMSYGFKDPNFTPMQRDKMRETINFNYPEILTPNNLYHPKPTYTLSDTKGSPITACTFSSTNTSNSYDNSLIFNINDLFFKNIYEKSGSFIDYSCALKTELKKGEIYSFNFEDINSSTLLYYHLYIDYNGDGDFEDISESVFSGQKNQGSAFGSLTIPSTAVSNQWLRARFVRSSVSNYSSCTTAGYGSALDFSVKLITGCSQPASPTVLNQQINYGQSTTLVATNCTGTIKWFSGGEFISSGSTLFTGNLFATKNYQASCTINNCSSLPSAVSVKVLQNMNIGSLSSIGYCANSSVTIPFTSSIPISSFLSVSLKKGGVLIKNKLVKNSGSISFEIPKSYTTYTGGPLVNLNFGNDYSIEIEYIDTYTNEVFKVISSPIMIGAIENSSHGVVKNKNEYFDVNNPKSTYTQLCQGKSKYIYAQVLALDNSNFTTEGLTFTWKKDGSTFLTTQADSILVNQAGKYTFEVQQGSCITSSSNSRPMNVQSVTALLNSVNTIGQDFGCNGGEKLIYSEYQSTTASYQWQQNGTNIPNATNKVLKANSSGNYGVIVSDQGCTIITGNAKAVSFTTGSPTKIQSINGDTTLCKYTNPYLNLTSSNVIRLEDVYGGGLTVPQLYSFQWQLNGQDISKTVKNYIDISYRDSLNTGLGIYRLKKQFGDCVSYSNEITISESNINPKPKILYGETLNACSGPINIQGPFQALNYLYKNGQSTGNAGYFFYLNESGEYKIKNGDGTCQNESDPIQVTIGNTINPKIKYVDNKKKNLCGTQDNVPLMFDFSGNSFAYSYQWFKNGSLIPGQTSYTIYVSTAGTYKLQVSSGSCTNFSNEIIIGNNNNDMILSTLDPNLECSGRVSLLEFKGLLNINPNLLTWKKNGTTLPPHQSVNFYTNEPGLYSVGYNNNFGCVGETNTVEIEIGSPPSGFSLDPVGNIPSGQSATLTVNNCLGKVNWYDTDIGGNLLYTGKDFTTPVLTQNSTYWISCSKDFCESSRVEVNISIVQCAQHIIHNSSILSQEYLAAQSIISSINVPTGVKYSAGNNILLSPGFSAGSNEVFEAVIGGCQN
ncbi:GEVED domain-containing protein [Lacihabitans sp. LS3-19]|uniref:Ig-like domain-containing protein n=1 Tax=Lacihabitans sp. LS3-19 TaxID=2487335 RepID=UPI0020CECF9E|nr:GEVED domain-containing protein [Lacihabitans sp. LS3-19]